MTCRAVLGLLLSARFQGHFPHSISDLLELKFDLEEQANLHTLKYHSCALILVTN